MNAQSRYCHINNPNIDTSVIPDDIYLQAKRTVISVGVTCAAAYLRRKLGEKKLTTQQVSDAFCFRLMNDTNRDDVKLGKCLHCIFRHHCSLYPNMSICHPIDDRFRKCGTSFNIYVNGELKVRYDCGWIQIDGKTPQNIFKKMPELPAMTQGTNVEIIAPFTGGLTLNHVLPNKKEIYDRYKKRVKRYEDEIRAELTNSKESPDKKLLAIINKIGQHDILMNDYGGDVMLMVADYWPYKTIEEVICEYTNGTALPLNKFFEKAKQELRAGGETK